MATPRAPTRTSIQDGAVVENFTFGDGWMDPKADGYDPAKLRAISFSDFYNPSEPGGTKS